MSSEMKRQPDAALPVVDTNDNIRAAATHVIRLLQQAGFVAYFAGGCVRDRIMGIEPKDYDIATSARPDQVQELFDRTIAIGEHFGVILVRLMKQRVEVATFRRENDYSDNRRPDSVEFTDAEEDALRRDFTINGMFEDPIAKRIIDFVGGQDDIQGKVIRAIRDPNKRLAEDHLRALRAVRFSSRFGFAIDPKTEDAIRTHASELAGVSRERLGQELRAALLAETHPVEAIRLMQSLHLDGPTLNEPNQEVPLHFLAQLQQPSSFATILAVWASDRGGLESDATELAERWRGALVLTNGEYDHLTFVLQTGGTLLQQGNWSSRSIANQKRLAAKPLFKETLRFLGAVRPSLARDIESECELLDQTASGISPRPLVTGDDLVKMGGVPGPHFKQVLDAVYDAYLEDRLATRNEALLLAEELLKRADS